LTRSQGVGNAPTPTQTAPRRQAQGLFHFKAGMGVLPLVNAREHREQYRLAARMSGRRYVAMKNTPRTGYAILGVQFDAACFVAG